MSFSVAALLTALPVVTMGGLALAGSWLHQHVSERRSVAISLLLIAVGALMRELYPQSALLLSSALLGGVGIGIIQAVMPSVINGGFGTVRHCDGAVVRGSDGRRWPWCRHYALVSST